MSKIVWLCASVLCVGCGGTVALGGPSSGSGGSAGRGGGGATSATGGSGTGGADASASGGTGGADAGGLGGSGAAGTGGAGASSGGSAGENCTNGVDDNGNGKIDCADPACQQAGYSCAPTVPGWEGPVAMWSGLAGSEPTCKGDYPSPAASGNRGLEPGTVTCQSCSCGAPTGGTCSGTYILYFDTTTCNSGCWGCSGQLFKLTDGAPCQISHEIHGPSGQTPKAAYFTHPTASGSSCAPQADNSGMSIATPTWTSAMVACGGEPTGGKGCGDITTECVPKPPSPFNSICIYQAGDKACPAGLYAKRNVYYAGYSDTRTCSNCTCGVPSGQSCPGTVKTYTDQCASDETVMTVPKKCYPVPADPTPSPYDGGLEDTRGATFTGGQPSGGSCAPGGAQPTGGVTGTGAVTFCCL